MKKNILCNIALFTFAISTSLTTIAASNQAAVPSNVAAPVTSAVEIGVLKVSNAWVRKSMPPNNNSAAYMKINNSSDKDVTVIGAAASMVANNVELHKSYVDEKGVSRMVSLDRIVIPAKTEIELEPGSLHIMMCDLKKNLNVGDKVDLEIKIDGSDKPLLVQAEVK